MSAFDQPNVTRARTLLGVLLSELNALTFAQKLKHRPPNRAAVEEMLDTAFVADKPEPFVDEESRDGAGWHSPKSSVPNPQGHPKGTQPVTAPATWNDAEPVESVPALG